MPDVMAKGLLLGFILVIVGIIVIMATIFYSILKSGEARYGGVVVIGPLPIVFGSDREMVKIAVVGAIILMIIAAIILMVLPLLVSKRVLG